MARRHDTQIRNATYEVGYGKPPKTTQFRKGQSGYPRGRKKTEEPDLNEILDRVLINEPVQVRIDGQVQTMSRVAQIVHHQMAKALQGDSMALLTLLRHARKANLLRPIIEKHIEITEPRGKAGQLLERYHGTRKSS